MIYFFKKIVRKILKKFDIVLIRASKLEQMSKRLRASSDIEVLFSLPQAQRGQLLDLIPQSSSEFRQDLFVLSELHFKTDGFFVDFGATDGVHMNNTCLLEKQFGWRGIVAEPARCWHDALKNNRHCNIETDCVWHDTGLQLTFNEVENPVLSTLQSFSSADFHHGSRKAGVRYQVRTISLNDLLEKYHAPRQIDYLSIDTEGSEYDILRDFDFDKYQISIITCEHNYTPLREKIKALLESKGYTRKFENLSQVDDWFVLKQ